MRIGLDVGSTTLKCVVLDDADKIIYKDYRRHFSRIAETSAQMLRGVMEETGLNSARLCVSGSAGMGLAQEPFMRTSGMPLTKRIFASSPPSSITVSASGESRRTAARVA